MQTLDQSRIEAFAGQIATEVGAALNAALVTVGDQLGLYRAMADAQPIRAGELAARTNTHERYVREWLNAQAAGGFVTYDSGEDSYTLPAEHAFILADESSPVAMAGIFQAATAVMDGRTRVAERFRTGEGVGWHEHHDGLFCGTERSFGANYRMHLVAGMASGAHRRRREAGTRRHGRRRRLRPRRVDDPHGAGVPGLDVHRHRRPCRVDRHGPHTRARRGRRRSRDLRGGGRHRIREAAATT